MPQLYFTDLRALRRPAIVDSVSHELPFEIIATPATFGLVDGMPFILGDDGSYDHDLNRFFRACPTMGLRSLPMPAILSSGCVSLPNGARANQSGQRIATTLLPSMKHVVCRLRDSEDHRNGSRRRKSPAGKHL
jgi:hypothetical protein